jgi:hypothetical protein
MVKRFVPILAWLPEYERSWLTFDAIAGLTLWGLLVPEAMAYAGVAGLPPQAGLYTLTVSLVVYALLGTSRHLSVGPTSATAALLASSVAAALVGAASATASDPQTYQTYASAFVLVTGVVFLVAALARLGFITQFLSKPVMDGFVAGLAIFVAVGQLNKLFGVAKPEGNTVEKLVGIIGELPGELAAFAVSALARGPSSGCRPEQEDPGWPRRAVRGDRPERRARPATPGVAVVGTLPQGRRWPCRTSRSTTTSRWCCRRSGRSVAFSESLGVAHEFAEKHGRGRRRPGAQRAWVVNLERLFGG